jgi:hypothetical protein
MSSQDTKAGRWPDSTLAINARLGEIGLNKQDLIEEICEALRISRATFFKRQGRGNWTLGEARWLSDRLGLPINAILSSDSPVLEYDQATLLRAYTVFQTVLRENGLKMSPELEGKAFAAFLHQCQKSGKVDSEILTEWLTIFDM